MARNSSPASVSVVNTPAPGEFWIQFEEQTLDGRFSLLKFIDAFQTGAVFLSRLEGQQQFVAVKMVSMAVTDAQYLGLSWKIAEQLQHPNLVRVYATGQASLGGLRVVYAVTDYWDESLDRILAERSLTPQEARDLMLNGAHALDFLHGKGLLQACLGPSAVVAVGDAIKLSSDHLVPVGQGRTLHRSPQPDDAPELSSAGASPASDIWGLGATVYTALTQRQPSTADRSAILALPAPFSEILSHCLLANPAQRWTTGAIEGALGAPRLGTSKSSYAAPPAAKPTFARVIEPTSRKGGIASWKVAIAAVAVLLALFVIVISLRRPARVAPATSQTVAREQPSVPPAPPAKAAEVTGKVSPFVPPAEQSKAPARSPANSNSRSVWRVVVYTYKTSEEAERKVASLNQRWPELHVAVFAPSDHPPILVVVGGPMNRDGATRLRRTLVASGFPSDTYINNYSH